MCVLFHPRYMTVDLFEVQYIDLEHRGKRWLKSTFAESTWLMISDQMTFREQILDSEMECIYIALF